MPNWNDKFRNGITPQTSQGYAVFDCFFVADGSAEPHTVLQSYGIITVRFQRYSHQKQLQGCIMPLSTVGNNHIPPATVAESSALRSSKPSTTVLRSLLKGSNTVDALPGNTALAAAEHNYSLTPLGSAFGNRANATSTESQAVRHTPPDGEEISPQQATDFFINYIEKIHTGKIPMPSGIDFEDINRRLRLPPATTAVGNKNVVEQTDHSIDNILGNPPPPQKPHS